MKIASCLMVSVAATDTLEKMAAHINSLGTSWKAAAPSRFGDFEDVKKTLGTIMKGQPGYTEEGLEPRSYEGENLDIPTDFDVRTAFPDCAEVSGNIRDQSSCGSCWAFGSTEAFNDRHCIATGDKTKFSVEDTTANCGFLQCFSMGCNGGQPGQAWNWFKNKGVVTGGDYTDKGKGDTCAPYSFAPCAHHVPATEEYPVCPSEEYSTPTLKECSEGAYGKGYADDKIKATDSYSLSGITNIQADIMQYGSATAAFTVYSDFPTYKSGVYTHTSGSQLGGHAIKLLGWGVEDGKDYWLVANSWNEMWGNGGTFKIARGNNECGIEGQVSAGRAGSAKVSASASLSGTYHGSVPFILDMSITFPGDGTMDFDQNIKVASTEVKCPTEKITEDDAQITFPESALDGDCLGDSLRGQSKDPSLFMINKNSDGTLTFKSDGWPDLKLKKVSVVV